MALELIYANPFAYLFCSKFHYLNFLTIFSKTKRKKLFSTKTNKNPF
jgi:hypothetical protein